MKANYKKMYLHSISSNDSSLDCIKKYLKDGDPSYLMQAAFILKSSQQVCEEIYLQSTEENSYI